MAHLLNVPPPMQLDMTVNDFVLAVLWIDSYVEARKRR
jgi:hypothetical protein